MNEDTVGDVSTFLWWLGWRFEVGVALGVILGFLVGSATSTPVGFFSGVLTGLGLWYLGTKEIDRTYWTLLDSHAEYSKQVRNNLLADYDGNCYTLNYSSDPSLWVTPHEVYFTTHALVADESITFHEGVGVNMRRRVPYIKDNVTEIRYEWISSIQYEKPYVRLELTSGKSIRYRANDRPDELFDDVRAHIQRQSQDISDTTAERVQREFS